MALLQFSIIRIQNSNVNDTVTPTSEYSCAYCTAFSLCEIKVTMSQKARKSHQDYGTTHNRFPTEPLGHNFSCMDLQIWIAWLVEAQFPTIKGPRNREWRPNVAYSATKQLSSTSPGPHPYPPDEQLLLPTTVVLILNTLPISLVYHCWYCPWKVLVKRVRVEVGWRLLYIKTKRCALIRQGKIGQQYFARHQHAIQLNSEKPSRSSKVCWSWVIQ